MQLLSLTWVNSTLHYILYKLNVFSNQDDDNNDGYYYSSKCYNSHFYDLNLDLNGLKLMYYYFELSVNWNIIFIFV